jgi:hypothetical protein
MKKKHLLLSLLICMVLIALCMRSATIQGEARSAAFREVYTGNLIYFDGTFGPTFGLRRGGRSGIGSEFFTLTVDSYTPEGEVSGILNALRNGGQDGLMKSLGREKRGTLQIGSRVGRDVQAIWVTRTEEGRKISALSERWQGFGELRRGARSLDYPFTYIEIFIEEDGGAGDGSLIPAARVRSKGGNNVEIENFGIYPARLTNIKVRRR